MMKKLLLCLLVLSLIAGWLLMNPDAAVSQTGFVGKPAPDFTIKRLDEKMLRISGLKGKVIVLNFWATWCPPCRREIPEFIQFFKDYEKKGVIVVGISLDRDEAYLREFVRSRGVNYPVAADPSGKIAKLYGGIRFVPTTFIIDRRSIIKEMRVGEISREELWKMVAPNL